MTLLLVDDLDEGPLVVPAGVVLNGCPQGAAVTRLELGLDGRQVHLGTPHTIIIIIIIIIITIIIIIIIV